MAQTETPEAYEERTRPAVIVNESTSEDVWFRFNGRDYCILKAGQDDAGNPKPQGFLASTEQAWHLFGDQRVLAEASRTGITREWQREIRRTQDRHGGVDGVIPSLIANGLLYVHGWPKGQQAFKTVQKERKAHAVSRPLEELLGRQGVVDAQVASVLGNPLDPSVIDRGREGAATANAVVGVAQGISDAQPGMARASSQPQVHEDTVEGKRVGVSRKRDTFTDGDISNRMR